MSEITSQFDDRTLLDCPITVPCPVHGDTPCLRWYSKNGLGAHPTTHDVLRWAADAPEGLQCECESCKAFREVAGLREENAALKHALRRLAADAIVTANALSSTDPVECICPNKGRAGWTSNCPLHGVIR